MSLPWMANAAREIGVMEWKGADKDNPRIIQYFRDGGITALSPSDAVSWCGVFLAAMFGRAGLKTPKNAQVARSWSAWGVAVPHTYGAVIVLSRPGGAAWQGHVGLYEGEDKTHVRLLGGNQGDAVTRAWFSKDRIVAVRWPSDHPLPKNPQPIPLMRGGATSPTDR